MDNGGIFVCKCRHLVLAGAGSANKGAGGGGAGGGLPGFMSPRLSSPAHPSQGGERGRRMGGGGGGGGGRGRGRGGLGRDKEFVGQTIKITQVKSHVMLSTMFNRSSFVYPRAPTKVTSELSRTPQSPLPGWSCTPSARQSQWTGPGSPSSTPGEWAATPGHSPLTAGRPCTLPAEPPCTTPLAPGRPCMDPRLRFMTDPGRLITAQ